MSSMKIFMLLRTRRYIYLLQEPHGPEQSIEGRAPSSSNGPDVPTVRTAISRVPCGGSDRPLGRSRHTEHTPVVPATVGAAPLPEPRKARAHDDPAGCPDRDGHAASSAHLRPRNGSETSRPAALISFDGVVRSCARTPTCPASSARMSRRVTVGYCRSFVRGRALADGAPTCAASSPCVSPSRKRTTLRDDGHTWTPRSWQGADTESPSA